MLFPRTCSFLRASLMYGPPRFQCSVLQDLLDQEHLQKRQHKVALRREQQAIHIQSTSSPIQSTPPPVQSTPSVPPETPPAEQKTRLTKLLSNSGVCSRREAERLIQQKKVLYKGKALEENVSLSGSQLKHVQVSTKNNTYDQVPQSGLRVWCYYKPRGLICSRDDPRGRTTIFQQIGLQEDMPEHVASVGRLDYNSEGLMLLTNNGDLARQLELPANQIVRTYKVRVFGRLDQDKLDSIRRGCVIKGVQYGPFLSCDITNRQTRNTWLRISMVTGKNREIRKIMQKHSLRTNRIVRLSYGPYSLENLKSGEVQEATVHFKMHRLHRRAIDHRLATTKTAIKTQQIQEQQQQAALPNSQNTLPQQKR